MVTRLKEKTNADCPSGDGPSWQEKAHCVHRIQKGELLPAGLQRLHWLLPANYQEGFCWPVFLRNKQHGSQVLGIRWHQPESLSIVHRRVSEGNMESSSCLCLRVNFFGNHGDHNVFVAPADNHVQGAFLLNDVADVVGGDHRLSIDADDDIIFLETPTATQREMRLHCFHFSWCSCQDRGATLHLQRHSLGPKSPEQRGWDGS